MTLTLVTDERGRYGVAESAASEEALVIRWFAEDREPEPEIVSVSELTIVGFAGFDPPSETFDVLAWAERVRAVAVPQARCEECGRWFDLATVGPDDPCPNCDADALVAIVVAA